MSGTLTRDDNQTPIQGGINPSGNPQSFQVDAQGNLKTSASVTPAANQRVSSQLGDFVAGSLVDGAISTLGNKADAAITNPALSASEIALLKGLLTVLLGTLGISGTVAVSNLPGTQAISAASLPLPSGASTAAKQPAIGTAGTPSADVVSIQGVAGGTPQPISASSLPLPTGAALEAGNLASLLASLGAVGDAAWSLSGNASAIAALKEIALLLNPLNIFASGDAKTASTVPEVAVGGYNGATIDRVLSDVQILRTSMWGKTTTNADTPATFTGTGINVNVMGVTNNPNMGVNTRVNSNPISPSNALPVSLGYSSAATQVTASASGSNATVSASLAAVAAKTNVVTGFIITGLPATALSSGDVTVTGLIGGTWTQEFSESTTGGGMLIAMFSEAIQASAVNTAIQVSVAALGASSAKVSVQIFGHYF